MGLNSIIENATDGEWGFGPSALCAYDDRGAPTGVVIGTKIHGESKVANLTVGVADAEFITTFNKEHMAELFAYMGACLRLQNYLGMEPMVGDDDQRAVYDREIYDLRFEVELATERLYRYWDEHGYEF